MKELIQTIQKATEEKKLQLQATLQVVDQMVDDGLDLLEALSVMRGSFFSGIEQFFIDGKCDVSLTAPTNGIIDFEIDHTVCMEHLKLQVKDVMLHKMFVVTACGKMAEILAERGESEKALLLMQRCYVHDLSKCNEDEFLGLAKYSYDNSAMTQKGVQHRSEEMMKAVRLHQIRNSHHPEFHAQVSDMSELDVIEMVCDWFSRSIQFKTDFLDWVVNKHQPRFKFPQEMFEQIVSLSTELSGSFAQVAA